MGKRKAICAFTVFLCLIYACESKEEKDTPISSPKTFQGQSVRKAKGISQLSKKHKQELDDAAGE